MIVFASIVAVLAVAIVLLLQHPAFGHAPRGARLDRIKHSPHYRDGKFRNLTPTAHMTGNKSFFRRLGEFLFGHVDRLRPEEALPVVQTDLRHLSRHRNLAVWLGHSSLIVQTDGLRFLVDPVMTSASPFPFMFKPFRGADAYHPEDLPAADVLIITHDHYDHLDYRTVKVLRDRIGQVICPLGVGEHLERWGYAPSCICELDWDESLVLPGNVKVHCLSSRHFSGRGLAPGNTLWASFLLETPQRKIFLSGDGGYDHRFQNIAARFGQIDWAFLENGQYNTDWSQIHMLPSQVVQAIKDLSPAHVIPIHSGKYALARHSWDEPLRLLSAAADREHLPLVTPMIGEVIDLNDSHPATRRWWEGLK